VPWTVDELRRWLDEIEPQIDALDQFAWLGLQPVAAYDDIQPAFHQVARTRHPDLFRTRLDAAEMDRLVRVYARITSAYAELRDPARYEALARPHRPPRAAGGTRTRTPVHGSRAPAQGSAAPPPSSPPSAPRPPQVARTRTPNTPASVPIELEPSRAMNARALAHYRRAEGALRVGDRTSALLHLRMALASDPTSQLLRAALAELLADDR
jgi:hypothetical protein